ncbi:Acetyl-CoA synthetase-like protein [Mycena indigotica]|uniref:Acetyl-CoA synthetase-like protein n=1 Tax=Mycena indigotica TaxID=2126181 RepID=A0A8H6VXB2_9AGAR|nr:Acetyl-CoA synthetase-like protein [Mycena indigotica]KAF7297287.1 Acetyl-CoA synthetase-like protein [Mycena indigotica]
MPSGTEHFMDTVLRSLDLYATRPLIKEVVGPVEARTCNIITYQAYAHDLSKAALFWWQTLSKLGVAVGDVVGLWITGSQYPDLVHLYAISRAGFVPQVFSQKYTEQGLAVVRDLLTACEAKVLLYDPVFEGIVQSPSLTLACQRIPPLVSLTYVDAALPSLPDVKPTDTAMIFHTSGTTSGKPKPVPESHRWFRFQAIQWKGICQAAPFDGQDVYNNIGSYGHVGSATMISHLGASGQCMVRLASNTLDREQILELTRLAGLNNLFIYAPWLSKLVNLAKTDPEILTVLRSMRQISYTGASLNPEDEQWIIESAIPATCVYATTEIALCLVSDLDRVKMIPAMRLVPGVQCQFIPTNSLTHELATNAHGQLTGNQLYDFFIPESAPNCPHPSIRNRPDGHISGDLFEEVSPGYYVFRGRNDDWIRTGPTCAFCDTKSIEDNCMLTCADLVKNCTVVGHYKPALVLFIEPALALSSESDLATFKMEILKQTAAFNARLFSHERITDARRIVVVPPGSLPRTTEKGNVRRKAVEEDYASLLQDIYTSKA